MVKIKISLNEILWNYLSNILNVSISIFLLPFLLNFLPAQDLGLWYVFTSIYSLVILFDFGFSPTIMRNISLAWSGSNEILKEGISDSKTQDKPNYILINQIIESSKKIYFIISIIILFLMLTVGTLYINSIIIENTYIKIIAWIVFSIATFINIYYTYLNPFLRGIGRIKESSIVIVVSRLLYLIITISGLIFFRNILWISISQLIFIMLSVLISNYYLIKLYYKNSPTKQVNNFESNKNIYDVILHNSKKMGLVLTGSWLINKSSTLLCSYYLGLETTSSFGLSLQVLVVIGGISNQLLNSYSPEIINAKLNKQNDRYLVLLSRVLSAQWVISIMGIFLFILFGPMLLRIIGSNTVLIRTEMLVVLSIIMFLEWNHSTFCSFVTFSNKVPFVKAFIISGAIIILLTYILLKYFKIGLWGIILVQGFVQLSYNNWKWPVMILRERNISFIRLLKISFSDFEIFIKVVQRIFKANTKNR